LEEVVVQHVVDQQGAVKTFSTLIYKAEQRYLTMG